jgi:hypothetical protein
MFSCRVKENKELEVLQWKMYKRKQDTTYIKQDTLTSNRNFLKLNGLGKINQDIIDTILTRKIIQQEYRLDSLVIWMNPSLEKQFKDTTLKLYNIYISDIKNGGELNFVYTKEYGVLMKIYNPYNILVLDKLTRLNKGGNKIGEISFTHLQNKLLNDTIIFPKKEVPPPPPPK